MRIFFSLLTILLIQGCADEYSQLEKYYEVNPDEKSDSFNESTVTMISTSTRGAYTFRNNIEVTLNENAIRFRVEPPYGYFFKPIEIPANDVSGCGKSCFRKDLWLTEIYISKTGTTIGVQNSNTLINWCWKNKIPIIPGDIERSWKYKGASLPPKSQFSAQFESLDNYIYLAKQSCLGY